MKKIAALFLLIATSCGRPVMGGEVVGKHILVYTFATSYFLQLEDGGRYGEVEVSKEAWEQAAKGMKWPFEVNEESSICTYVSSCMF